MAACEIVNCNGVEVQCQVSRFFILLLLIYLFQGFFYGEVASGLIKNHLGCIAGTCLLCDLDRQFIS